MTETEKAYIAAAIDGEGCITLKTRRTTRTPWLADARVYVTNTNKAWLEWIATTVGLGGGIQKNGKPWPNGKPGFRYCIDSQRAKELLRQVLPYLRMKKKQAELVLSLQPIVPGTCRGGFPEAIRVERTRVWDEIKKLNKRGLVH